MNIPRPDENGVMQTHYTVVTPKLELSTQTIPFTPYSKKAPTPEERAISKAHAQVDEMRADLKGQLIIAKAAQELAELRAKLDEFKPKPAPKTKKPKTSRTRKGGKKA